MKPRNGGGSKTGTSMSHKEAASKLLANLTPYETSHSIVYMAESPVAGGSKLQFPHITIDVPRTSFIAFVDREPMANWSHSSRYILLDDETGEATSFESQFPPFRPNLGIKWRVAYRAPSVSAALVMTSE